MAEPSLLEDLNLDRRKRIKTSSPEPATEVSSAAHAVETLPSDLNQQLHVGAGLAQIQDVKNSALVRNPGHLNSKNDETPDSLHSQAVEDVNENIPFKSSPPQATENHPRFITPPRAAQDVVMLGHGTTVAMVSTEIDAKASPKKQIRVTKSGKLVSSPPRPDPSISTLPKKRGRPRKAFKINNISATITIIKYGSDNASKSAIGQKIEAILSGVRSSDNPPTIVPPKLAGPPKISHPFFTGKAGQKKVAASAKPDVERQPVIQKKSACTPGKLRAERRKEKDDEITPAFGMTSKDNRLAKQLGLNEPSWPSKATAHVRNLDNEDEIQSSTMSRVKETTLKPAKLKSNVYTLPADEEIIARLAQQLSEKINLRSDLTHMDFAPPEDVRLPRRLLTTGIDIQHKVRTQIRAPIETLSDRLFAKTHPAITTLFDSIENTLTSFDEGRCEAQMWTQKYKPSQADHVLQSGKEAFVLKDWLKSLTVMAVSAAHDTSKTSVPPDTKKPPKKKRKMAADDFIVSDDDEEEEEEMVEFSQYNGTAPSQYPSLRRPRWTRNKNVILLSGPHGCGKSATVYAVAKELDFEVFELHSGVRRSGKDIQDKVGDMTANHLVNHQRSDLPVKAKPASLLAADDTDNERMDTAFAKDLASGKQGTMTSFFAAKPTAQSKLKPRTKLKPKVQVEVKSPAKTKVLPAAQAMLPMAATRKSQKQSLILIEEANILFEEDQNFWAQITKLAAQSKRPIVITCNDELHIPIQALPMAAILRLTSAPVDLAADYLIALAGKEGHILQRQSVIDLYRSKDHDLRASITELNFWCQMSVGDKKGGLEWMYQRWPPGNDVDAHGRLLRVASEDTYQSGMGWLSQNVLQTKSTVAFDKEEELLMEIWNDWGINPATCRTKESSNTPLPILSEETQLAQLSKLDRLVAFSDALSASDMYSRISLPSYENMHDQPLDPTLPPIPDKERLSYTIDAPLLQADDRTDFLALTTSLSTQTHVLLHRLFPDLAHHPSAPLSATPTNQEDFYTRQILNHKAESDKLSPLPRSTFSTAFDILASPPDQDLFYDHRSSYNLLLSSFDRPLPIVTLDLAPYVRSIVAYEQVLETQRIRLGCLLSEGGRSKRARMTKSSRTAMEGGERSMKRRERWFSKDLNFELVMQTAGMWGKKGESDGRKSMDGSLMEAGFRENN